ncbi:LacI family DNA-binding transcriptional regulator [Neobacillus sp. 179-J 1A1 HS]|uniref:LacI family DNA-binding transcriptional regulator n=1 Tax=Neobacillus driksii TaxID=3035913 RepID=UPI0035BC1753
MKEFLSIKATENDIARMAGVSQTTVSRVLNNHPSVKASTRLKVMAAIKEMGFIPDPIARSMVTNKTGTIGLIVGDIANPFYAETAKIIIRDARTKGYDVILSDTNDDSDNLQKEMKMLLNRRVDGILIASVNRWDSFAKELHQSGFPVILFNRKTDDLQMHSVNLDNGQGAQIAVKHLVDLGHRHISFISGPAKFSTFHERYQGFKKALKWYNLPLNQNMIFQGNLTYEEIVYFIKVALSLEESPTSFFASTDHSAIFVMDAVARMGLKVPEEISIVGFDDIDISSNPYINLTTISQQKQKMASIALEKLLFLIDNPASLQNPSHVTIVPELIIRGTTARNRKLHYLEQNR